MTLSAAQTDAKGEITHELFRRVMASFVTGVTVVTTEVRG